MLLSEIEPFADHHIAKLTEVLDTFHPEHADSKPAALLSAEEIYEIARDARQALVRFKICMVDEVTQKKKLHEKALNCRLNH